MKAPELGRKTDAGKPRMSLVPWRAMAAVVRVLEFGAKKYGVGNWLHVADLRTRYFDAAQRHLLAWWGGERFDDDTGESHLAHAACCLLFLLAVELGERADVTTTTVSSCASIHMGERCQRVEGHTGPHHSTSFTWPWLSTEEVRDGLKAIQDSFTARPSGE